MTLSHHSTIKRSACWLGFCFVALMLWSGCSSPKPEHSLFDIDREVFRPYLWGYTPKIIRRNAGTNELQQHPLYLARHAFASLYFGKLEKDSFLIKTGKTLLDSLALYPHRIVSDSTDLYLYPFVHKEIPAGWWSGMANGSVSLAFLLGAEIFNSDFYLDKSIRAIRGVTHKVQSNGSKIPTPLGNAWYLEYSHPEVADSNAYYVLNGFLYGLLAIKIFDATFPDMDMEPTYQSGLAAIKEYNYRFYYPDSLWTFYMLHPPTPESTHYCIYDLLLYDCLAGLDTASFYQDQIKIRQKLLRSAYPVFEKPLDGSHAYLFSHLGAPHPYWLDTYPVAVKMYKDKKLLRFLKNRQLKNTKFPFKDRAFLSDTIPQKADSFRVFSVYNQDSLLLWAHHSSRSADETTVTLKPKEVLTKGAAQWQGGVFSLTAKNDSQTYKSASWTFVLDTPFHLEKYPYFALQLKPSKAVKSVLVALENADSMKVSRYYYPLQTDTNNLILLHWTGFRAGYRLKNREVKSLTLTLFLDANDQRHEQNLEITPWILFKDQWALRTYFNNNAFWFPEKKVHTKLY